MALYSYQEYEKKYKDEYLRRLNSLVEISLEFLRFD